MLEAVNYANKPEACQYSKNQVMFRGTQGAVSIEQKPDTFEKQGMSNGTKAAIGIGGILAAIAVGFGIKKGLDYKAAKKTAKEALEYLEQCTYKKSANAGENVQETINNILGKDSGIVPHTYDVSKEFPAIHVYRYQGGYTDGLVTPDGMQIGRSPYPKLLSSATSHSPKDGNVPDVKNKVIRLPLPESGDRSDNPLTYLMTFISPNQNYTPLQRDVLKLMEHPEKIDAGIFDKICKFMNANDSQGKLIMENIGKYENLDYDLILSAIQSMAKGL